MVLSILIVNFNGGELVERCLESIFANPPDEHFEVIFVDNASTDGSFARIKECYPQLRFIAERENLGLAKAFNHALAVAQGEYLLSLDNDTRVGPGSLQALIDALRADSGLGVVGSFLLNPDMTLQRTFRRRPSALNAVFGRRSWVTRVWPTNPLSSRYLMDEKLNESRPFDVDWVSTAALMISRKAFLKAGGLDESFFVYWVDADWCARVKQAGYRIAAIPESRIIHDENLKAKRRTRKSTRMVIDFHRGAYRYYRKNHASAALHPMAAVALLGLTCRAMVLIGSDYIRWWLASRHPS